MRKIYVDTNVFIDAVTGRKNRRGRDLSVPAGKIFTDAMSCKYYVVVSNLTLQELYGLVDSSKLRVLFKMIEKKIIKVDYSEKEKEEARNLDPENSKDALHGLLAVKAEAECVITRDLSGFACVSNLIQAKLPEQL